MNKYIALGASILFWLVAVDNAILAINDPFFSYGHALEEAEPSGAHGQLMETYLAGCWHFLPGKNEHQQAHKKAVSILFEKKFGELPEALPFSAEFLQKACQKIQIGGQKSLDKANQLLQERIKALEKERTQHGLCETRQQELEQELAQAKAGLSTNVGALETLKTQCKDLASCQQRQQELESQITDAEKSTTKSLETIKNLEKESATKDTSYNEQLGALNRDLAQVKLDLTKSLSELATQKVQCQDFDICKSDRDALRESLTKANNDLTDAKTRFDTLQAQLISSHQVEMESLRKEIGDAQTALTKSIAELQAEQASSGEKQRVEQELRSQLQEAESGKTQCTASLTKFDDIGTANVAFIQSQETLRDALGAYNKILAAKEKTSITPAAAALHQALINARKASDVLKQAFDTAYGSVLSVCIAKEEDVEAILLAEGIGD